MHNKVIAKFKKQTAYKPVGFRFFMRINVMNGKNYGPATQLKSQTDGGINGSQRQTPPLSME